MVLCVFVKNKYKNSLTRIEKQSKAQGIGKVIGNKGGMIIAFSIQNTSFCFINCHLAAFVNNVQKRN